VRVVLDPTIVIDRAPRVENDTFSDPRPNVHDCSRHDDTARTDRHSARDDRSGVYSCEEGQPSRLEERRKELAVSIVADRDKPVRHAVPLESWKHLTTADHFYPLKSRTRLSAVVEPYDYIKGCLSPYDLQYRATVSTETEKAGSREGHRPGHADVQSVRLERLRAKIDGACV
jgi:hypothetical protein